MEPLTVLELKAILECPRRYQLIKQRWAFQTPEIGARVTHALRRSVWAWLSGRMDKGSELMGYYWSLWPLNATKEEIAASKDGARLLHEWYKSHQFRSVICEAILGIDELTEVSYHGVSVSCPLDIRWVRGGREDYVVLFLEPPLLPEFNLIIHHLWHHMMLNEKSGEILLYNFRNNCYSKIEKINPDLYMQSLKSAQWLLSQGAGYATFSGCSSCRVSERCSKNEAFL